MARDQSPEEQPRRGAIKPSLCPISCCAAINQAGLSFRATPMRPAMLVPVVIALRTVAGQFSSIAKPLGKTVVPT